MSSRRDFLKLTAASGMLAAAPSGPRIWDLHCHLVGFSGATPEEQMANMVRLGDRMGVERFVLFMGVKMPINHNPGPQEVRELNDLSLRALRQWHHRAFGFVYLTPEHVAFSLEELNRCVRDGPMVGVKLLVAKRASAPELDLIVERASALGAPVFQHTWFKTGGSTLGGGNVPGESTPLDVAELARRHPKATLICGHTGGNWELGVRAIRANANVSIDLAGSDPTAGETEMGVRILGAERVLYGSDVGVRSYASQLAKVMGAEIPEAARKLILGENLRRMLRPILDAKGVRV